MSIRLLLTRREARASREDAGLLRSRAPIRELRLPSEEVDTEARGTNGGATPVRPAYGRVTFEVWRRVMRFIITARPDENSAQPDPNAPLDEELFSSYMKFNEEMHKAGVLVAAEGLKPGGEVARIEVKKGKRGVVDGPFTESKELVGGFYIIEGTSQDAAVEWALPGPVGCGS